MDSGRSPAGLPTVLRLEKANRTVLPAAFAGGPVVDWKPTYDHSCCLLFSAP
jgi:hypothetical protein